MARSLRSPGHLALMQVLRATRQKAGLTQVELAARLHRPQSWVAKVEGGERRLDVVELAEVSLALGIDPGELVGPVVAALANSESQ